MTLNVRSVSLTCVYEGTNNAMRKDAFLESHLARLGGRSVSLTPYLGQKNWQELKSRYSNPPDYSCQHYPSTPEGMVLCAVEDIPYSHNGYPPFWNGVTIRVLYNNYRAMPDPYAVFCFLPMITEGEETLLWMARQFRYSKVFDNWGTVIFRKER